MKQMPLIYPFYRWEQWSKERLSSCLKSHMWDSQDLNPLWFRPRPLGSTQCLSAPLPKGLPQRILSLGSNWYHAVRRVSLHPPHNHFSWAHATSWALSCGYNASVTRPGSHPHRGTPLRSNGKKPLFCWFTKKKKLGTTSLSTEGQFNKLWYIHIMKYSVAVKNANRERCP